LAPFEIFCLLLWYLGKSDHIVEIRGVTIHLYDDNHKLQFMKSSDAKASKSHLKIFL